MNLKEIKGDVKFYTNEDGQLFQQILEGEVEPVLDGAIHYREVKEDGDYTIRYDLNGINGFSVWSSGEVNYQDNLWTLSEAEDYILNELPRCCANCQRLVYLQQTPEWEVCEVCENVFCEDCINWKHSSSEEGMICKLCSENR